jgi:transcriptional regulator with XRE-family HTH domain
MSVAEAIPLDEAPARRGKSALNDQVGIRARELRKASGLTLKDIALRMGTTPQTVQRLETGSMTISLDWLEAFAAALGIPVILFFVTPGTDAESATELMICKEVDRRVAETAKTLAAWLRDQAATLDRQPNA